MISSGRSCQTAANDHSGPGVDTAHATRGTHVPLPKLPRQPLHPMAGPHPSLSVRVFTPSDAVPLTELLHSAYAELGALGLNYTAVDQDEETTLVRASAGQCWVVEQNGVLVATLTVSLPPSAELREMAKEARVPNRAWLNQVAVSRDFRGTGIARHLWQLGCAWARVEGATSFGVDTATPANHLVQMYARWGFQPSGMIHWSGKTYDSVVMTRDLAE